MERVIHKPLKGSGRVGKAKEHYSQFEESLVSNKGSFSLISIFDIDIIISPMGIKLGKDLSFLEFVYKFGNEGERVCIMDDMLINIVIILTGTETSISFFLTIKKKDACGEFEGWILPVFKFLLRKSSVAFCFSGEREYTLPIWGLKDSSRVIS